MPPPPTPTVQSQVEVNQEGVEKRRLDTPLAAMLPSKYANVDVTELFPDFRHGKVSLPCFIGLVCVGVGFKVLKTLRTG